MAKSYRAGQSPGARRGASPARRPSRTWVWAVVGVIVVAALAALAVQNIRQTADIQGVRFFTGLTANHTAGSVTYAQTPPVGGDHSAYAQSCGIYDKPVTNENAVHSLEHGAVWITYRPDLPGADVETLRRLVRGRSHLLLSPYEGLPAPVVASGWGVQLQLTGADDARLARFIRQYERGPQTPERGADCTGAGSPLM